MDMHSKSSTSVKASVCFHFFVLMAILIILMLMQNDSQYNMSLKEHNCGLMSVKGTFMTVLWRYMRQIRLKSTGVNWARKCHRTVAGNNLSPPLYQLSVEDCFGVKSWGKLLQLLLKRCRICDGTDPVGNPTHRRLADVLVWCLTGLPSDSSSTAAQLQIRCLFLLFRSRLL